MNSWIGHSPVIDEKIFSEELILQVEDRHTDVVQLSGKQMDTLFHICSVQQYYTSSSRKLNTHMKTFDAVFPFD